MCKWTSERSKYYVAWSILNIIWDYYILLYYILLLYWNLSGLYLYYFMIYIAEDWYKQWTQTQVKLIECHDNIIPE